LLIQENPGCTAARLAHALGISTPNMALWLDRVTGKGLVQRLPCASDRRAVPLQLSVQGETLAKTALAAVKAAESSGLDALSEAERAMLAELLHKAAQHRPGADR
jgi:DNA-binding MarR family transcriptional regulator